MKTLFSTEKQLLFAFASSLLLVASFPLFGYWPLAWIALVPLLFAIESAETKKGAFLIGWASGFVYYFISVAWLRHVALAGWVLASVFEGLYIGIFTLFSKIFFEREKKLFPFLGVLILPIFWVALEWVRAELPPLGCGWNLIAYSQTPCLPLIQASRIFGAYGISFLVVFFNAAVYFFLRQFVEGDRKNRTNRIIPAVPILLGILLIGLFVLYGRHILSCPPDGPTIRASVIQGNIPQEDKWNPFLKDTMIDIHLKLTELASYENTDLVIWPEAAYPGYLLREAEGERILSLARRLRLPVLVGTIHREGDRYFNSAVLVSKEGSPSARYDKQNLVPYGEYVPLGSLLPFLKPIASALGISDFSSGKEATVFKLPSISKKSVFEPAFSVLICFEDTFPLLARRFVLKGAQFLVVITNDAWFKKGGEPYQHLQASQFRAVENDVFIVRAANTGVSCIVSSKGEVVSRVRGDRGDDIFVTGRLTDTVYLGNKPTFYQKYGFVFPYICATFAIIVLIPAISLPLHRNGK